MAFIRLSFLSGLSLLEKNNLLDRKIARRLRIKNLLQKSTPLLPPSYITEDVATDVYTNNHNKKPKFYDQKKTRAYKISGAILAGINEAIFMFSKYVTFTGLCIVILGGIGVIFSPLLFIVLAVALTLFTLIMAGIGVSKFLGAVKNVNNLAEDPVLNILRGQVKHPLIEDKIPLDKKQKNILEYQKFLDNLESYPGLMGLIIKKLLFKKAIIKVADNFPVIKSHFRAIEAMTRYSYLFAVSLGALTSGTILAAGIAGVGITGLGAILSASMLSGFGIPVVAVVIIGVTLLVAAALIYYKKKYENPLAKAQRDAAKEKAELIELKCKSIGKDSKKTKKSKKTTSVKSPIRLSKTPKDISSNIENTTEQDLTTNINTHPNGECLQI